MNFLKMENKENKKQQKNFNNFLCPENPGFSRFSKSFKTENFEDKENKKLYFWHFLTSVIYISLVTGAIFFLNVNDLLKRISTFDFILMSFAVFRLTRLFVDDMIFNFVRDYFGKFEYGLGKSISQLVNCPWCVGIWMALFIVFIYFLTPLSWFFILILALAGVGSILQIIITLIIRLNKN